MVQVHNLRLDVLPISLPTPYTFLGSIKGGGSNIHILTTMAHTFASDVDHAFIRGSFSDN